MGLLSQVGKTIGKHALKGSKKKVIKGVLAFLASKAAKKLLKK